MHTFDLFGAGRLELVIMERTLSEAQERTLLRKHLLNDFGTHRWGTIKALLDSGMIHVEGKYLMVSPKGAEYCDTFHSVMPNPFTASY